MAKQLNVNLSFTADTEKAKAQIRELQNALTKITQNASKTSPLGLTEDVNSAIKKVTELQTILQKATTETGSLDLGQFNQELKKANLSAETIKNSLVALGSEGQAAFAKIAQSISMAEIPLKRTNGLLAEFATTLKNTARWQLSSSILHGFIGSVQSAYRYAQDLNSSLNDIRIVTGQSTEQMAEFAKQANESAKALSATTTAYTDAALIFYQQGLGDEAVKERTDTVIKISNVTGEAVKDVSSYMTAIWNNFDDGSESLEHYADVITALGAATASSSEEIAGGLEKFASIGKTVGLSYDYATAALATVVSATRQSEDVVGNAFKTIFSRIQGLKLGETLEDDVDLNKYSAALKAVGVEVVTSSGQLRDLDNILDDLASKWDNLTSAQQTALAQTVAGTRQYAQFIALMGNWDSMTKNLEIARGAEGSLQEQADIYAESWEAARKRVKASAQAIYDDLLDDQFFIKLTDAISKVLDGIHNVIESIGGLKGVIPIISSLLLKMFSGDIVNSMNNFIYNIQLMSNKGRQAIIDRRKEFNEALVSMRVDMEDLPSIGDLYQKQGESQNQLIEKTVELQQKGKELTEQEQLLLQAYNDQTNALIEQAHQKEVLRQQTQTELAEEEITTAQAISKKAYSSLGYKNEVGWTEGLHEATRNQQALELLKKTIFEIKQVSKDGIIDKGARDSLKTILEQTKLVDIEFEKLPPSIKKIYNELEKLTKEEESADVNLGELNRTINNLSKNSNFVPTLEAIKNSLIKTGTATKEEIKYIDDLINTTKKLSSDTLDSAKSFNSASKSIDNLNQQYNKLKGTTITTSQTIVAMGQGFSSFAMYLNSIHSLIDGITNPDLSGIERLTTIMMSLGMVVNGFTSTTKSLGTVVNWINELSGLSLLTQQKKIALTKAETITTINHTQAEVAYYMAQKIKNLNDKETIKIGGKYVLVSELKTKSDEELMAVTAGLTTAEKARLGVQGPLKAGILGVKNATDSLKASLVSNPYGWVLLAIGAIVAGLSLWASHDKKVKEAEIEASKAEIERINKIQEEVNANQKLIKQYNELYDAYKDGQKTKEDLYDITDQLVEKYNLEGAALAKLTGNYEELTKSIEQASAKELNKTIKDTQISIEDIKNNTLKENQRNAASSIWYTPISPKYLPRLLTGDLSWSGAQAEADWEWSHKVTQIRSQNDLDKNIIGEGIDFNDNLYDFNSILKNYNYAVEKLDEIRNRYTSKELSQTTIDDQLSKYINQWSESIEKYKEEVKELEEYEAQLEVLNIDPKEINNLDDYDIALKEVTKALEKQGVETKRAEELTKTYLAQRSSEFKGYQEQKQLISDLTTEWNNLDEAELRNIITSGKFSEEQLRMIINLNINPSSEEDIQNYLDNTNARLKIEHFDVNSEALNAALDDLIKDKQVSDDVMASLKESFSDFDWESFGTETYINQLEIINNLLDKQNKLLYEGHKEQEETSPELAKQREKEIEEQEKKIKNQEILIENLKREAGEESEAVKQAQKELTNLQTKLTELLNSDQFDFEADYLDVIEKTYENHVNSIISAAEVAKSAAELIGEGFKVAAEDAQALFDIYPELYDQADVLATGEIQLNQQVVETVLQGNTDVIKSNRQVAIDELEQKIELTEAQMNYYKLQMDAISKYLSGEVDKNETEQTLDKNTADFKENLNKTLTENQIKDAEQAANANTEMARIACGNIAKIGTEAEELGKVLNAALSGRVYKGSFNKDGLGGNVTQYSNLDYKAVDEVVARDGAQYVSEMQKQMEQLSALYEGASKEDAYYKNLLSKLYAANNELDTTLEGVGKAKSSGSSSKQDLKDLKEYLDEFDRFYPIKKAIEDVSDALSDLSKQQQHLAGKALANSLKEQNKLLQNQAELYKELLTEQEDYRNELAGTLGSFGMTFDAATGNITNYATATQSALDKYNQAIITYNASAQDEVAKATLKTAEDEYNVFKNTLSKYQSILKDIESTTNNLDDIFYKQIENNFKAFEVEIKLDLDIEDAKRKVLDFIQEINTDFKKVYKTTAEWTKLFDVAAKKVETFTEQEGTLSTDLKELKQIADIIDDPNYNYGSSDALFASKSDAINKYKEITETLMSDSKELYSLYESSWRNYLSAVDEVKDQWSNVIKDFEKINKTLDHYSKLIELLYGGEETVAGRNYLDELYGAQANNSLAKQTALKEEILALQKEYDEILAAGADQNDEDVKRIAEAIEDASDELNSEIEDYLDTIQKKLTNSIKSIMDTADKAMTQDIGINKVIERWNDAKEAAEGYYDETERIYQLQKTENDWQDLISSTSRIKDQQYLKQIMDSQLKNLKEKTKLSEYDIQLAEKELEVQKAYIALQNAQNSKNSMKLVRNQQGNWTYQYVADQNEVLDKQQDFLDALNQKYEFVKEKSAETTEKVMNLYQTANEKLTALLQEYTTADETRRAEIKEEYDYFYEYYYGSEGVIVQAAKECADIQNDVTSTMMQLLEGHYEVNEKNFEEMTLEQQRLVEELKDTGISNFGELSIALGDKESGIYRDIYQHAEEVLNAQNTDWQNLAQNIIDSWAEDPDKNVRDVIRDSYDQIMDKVKEYDGAIKASEEASGIAWRNIKIDIDETTQSFDTLIQKTDALSDFKTHVDAISTAWLNVKNSIEAAVSALDDYLKLLKEDTGKPQTPDYSTSTVGTGGGYTVSDNNNSNGDSGNNNNSDNGNDEKVENAELPKSEFKKQTWRIREEGSGVDTGTYDSESQALSAIDKAGNSVVTTNRNSKIIYYKKGKFYKLVNNGSILKSNLTEEEAKSALKSYPPGTTMIAYATGGYTGDWNSSEGRLAVLHEKELVLNKEDTSNILNAVNLVRGISNISDLVSNAISSNLAGMALSLTGLGSSTINRNISNNNSSNNTFNITAEFPNAGNVEEIREAILSLPNLAAQYLAQK